MPTTVLIVDDHPSFRSVARMLLETEGYEVVGRMAPGPAIVLVSSRDKRDIGPLDDPVKGFIAKAELSGDALREVLAT